MPENPDELLAQQRAALLGWWFARGAQLTTRQVADRLGITWVGAHVLLDKLSSVIPITRDDSVCEAYWYSIEHVT
jgi:hypothetical protein